MAGLEAFARDRRLDSAQITTIGAFSRAIFGFLVRERKEYDRIPVEEQVEVPSLIGDISPDEEQLQAQVHGVVGRRDGTTRGGHLPEAHVWPTP